MEASARPPAIASTKTCPVCGNVIQAAAKVCYHCRTRFQLTRSGYCSTCRAIVETDDEGNCTGCGATAADVRVDSTVLERGEDRTDRAVPRAAVTTQLPPATREAASAGVLQDPAARIVADCRLAGVHLERHGDRIRVTRARGVPIDDALRGRIAANKGSLLAYLDAGGSGGAAPRSSATDGRADESLGSPGAPGQAMRRPRPRSGSRRLTPGQAAQGSMAAGAFVIFACFLPWSESDAFDMTVIETKPPGFLVAGIVLIIMGIAFILGRRVLRALLVLSLVILLTGIGAFGIVVHAAATISGEGLSLAPGYYIAAFAGFLAITAGVQAIVVYLRLRAERR